MHVRPVPEVVTGHPDAVRALTGLFGVRPRLADLLRDRLPPDLAGIRAGTGG
ncbi:hypothetical protein GCM10009557_95530 [Virgisporangium ochraceum]|uniref:Uncharacterized protein n=1 Tax=Virgisporangium ochraceum TaxID=65505 RepID=A0A8J4A1C9_9ACTN|nr:hypothetical protein Voc01_088990 [Virgisporangium ochraceum]